MPEQKVKLIGVELEGGWDEPPQTDIIHGDGSVKVRAEFVGEISSNAMTLPDLLEWMKRCYPDVTDRSCGLHIHVSFVDKLCYMQLMSRSFEIYFRKRVKAWATGNVKDGTIFWERFNGKNGYCKRGFIPEKQVSQKSKTDVRYRQLNYCWGLYGTIECRLFPAFQKVELSLQAVKLYHDICNDYLNMLKPEKPIKIRVMGDKNEHILVQEAIEI